MCSEILSRCARIEEAAAAASRVTHPAIVSSIERIGGRDDLALVFPYFDGTTLAQRLASNAAMAPRDAASIALDIADALATAHDGGVAHRDVKPANILVGADGQARLLDFGISRAFDEGDRAELTGAGLAIGTLPYMAPEQLAAAPPTPASDVYGLGVVLYEMLAGRRPYAAASPVALANEQSLPPARIDGAPVPLGDIALEAMSADTAARPSASGLARGLRAWLDGRADSAAPTVTVMAAKPLGTKASRANPVAALIAIGLIAVLLVAALPFMAFGWGETAPSGAFTATPSPVPTAPATPSAPREPSVVGAGSNNPPNRPSDDKPDKKKHDKKKDDDKKKRH